MRTVRWSQRWQRSWGRPRDDGRILSHVSAGGADRHRPHRIVDQPCMPARGACENDRRFGADAADGRDGAEARHHRSGIRKRAGGGRGRRSRDLVCAGGLVRADREGDRAGIAAGCDPDGRGLSQGLDRARCGAACAGRRALRGGASDRGHGAVGAGIGLCGTVRWALVHPDTGSGNGSRRQSRSSSCSGSGSARMWRSCRRIITIWCWRSPRICRI